MPGLQAGAVATSTSTSAHESRSPWDYAVPLENGNIAHRQGAVPSTVKSRYPNGVDKNGYLDIQPNSLDRPDSTISSTRDGDSLLDLYNGRMSVNGNNIDGAEVVDDSKWIDSEKLARIEGRQLEYAKWIDRDKLERIEIEELEKAGIRLPLKSSRASLQNLQKQYYHDAGDLKRQRTNSGSSNEEVQNYYTPDERTYEPRYANLQSSDTPSHPMKNGQRIVSGSKIPVLTQSRIPVPRQTKDKAGSTRQQQSSPEQGSDEDSTYTQSHTRKRSYSAGSAILLNSEGESGTSTVAKPAVPKATRTQSYNSTKPAEKKNTKQARTSTSNSTLAKNKTKSNPQLVPPHRPTTAVSSGHRDAPEGPPPWSSTFSPDPKLPPDQQLIPTVAKRLQQEQWEKEGAFATVYDGKLRPLKVQDFSDPPPRPEQDTEDKEEQEEVKVEENVTEERVESPREYARDQWPLRSPSPPIDTPVPSPGAEEPVKLEQAGDNFVEKTPIEPRTVTKVNGRTMGDTGPVRQFPVAPDGDEAIDGKKKKFLCCIVM